MAKKKIFISSVQAELEQERKSLHEYICADPLLGKFFEPFLFEFLPAIDQRIDMIYLKEVEQSDIYLGIFGKEYGSENKEGISPTELEFNHATKFYKTRLVFLTHHSTEERHIKENQLINKAQEVLIRKKFNTIDELKSAVYAALVRYLEDKEIIRSGPFDASLNATAKLDDIDDERVETRAEQVSIPGAYEIPKEVIAEAIVNAIAHRDYTSNASVQVMLFKDRLEILNPGSLPMGWTTEKLKQLHTSVPANPLLAEPLYLAGYIERMGTGTSDMVTKSLAAGLQEPQYIQTEDFRSILFRPNIYQEGAPVSDYPTPHDTPHDTPHETYPDLQNITPLLKRLIMAFEGDLTRQEIQIRIGIKDRKYFREKYLSPAINLGIVSPVGEYNSKDKTQEYCLTAKGKELKEELKMKK